MWSGPVFEESVGPSIISCLRGAAPPGCPIVTHRVGAREVVASHHLHVGLFYQGHPELVPVAGVGAQQLAVVIHRQEVVYYHLQQRHRDGDLYWWVVLMVKKMWFRVSVKKSSLDHRLWALCRTFTFTHQQFLPLIYRTLYCILLRLIHAAFTYKKRCVYFKQMHCVLRLSSLNYWLRCPLTIPGGTAPYHLFISVSINF